MLTVEVLREDREREGGQRRRSSSTRSPTIAEPRGERNAPRQIQCLGLILREELLLPQRIYEIPQIVVEEGDEREIARIILGYGGSFPREDFSEAVQSEASARGRKREIERNTAYEWITPLIRLTLITSSARRQR